MILRGVLLELRDQIEHDRHLVDAHSGGRLVEHEDLRLERDHQRDLELALVAMRQRRRSAVAPMRERDALEHRVRARDQVGALHPRPQHVVVHAGSGLHGEAHVLGDRKARKQIGELECAAEPGSRTRGRREPRDVLPVEQDLTRARGKLPGDQVEIGGLAGAVRPDDRGQLAGPERATHRIDGHVAAEANGEIAGFEGGHGAGRVLGAVPPPERGRSTREARSGGGVDLASETPSPNPPPFRGRERTAFAADSRHRLFWIGTCMSSILSSRTELRDAPRDRRVSLDLEVIHALERLMVLLAEHHLALRRVELHAFHRGDQLLGVGRLRLAAPPSPPPSRPRSRPP